MCIPRERKRPTAATNRAAMSPATALGVRSEANHPLAPPARRQTADRLVSQEPDAGMREWTGTTSKLHALAALTTLARIALEALSRADGHDVNPLRRSSPRACRFLFPSVHASMHAFHEGLSRCAVSPPARSPASVEKFRW